MNRLTARLLPLAFALSTQAFMPYSDLLTGFAGVGAAGRLFLEVTAERLDAKGGVLLAVADAAGSDVESTSTISASDADPTSTSSFLRRENRAKNAASPTSVAVFPVVPPVKDGL